MFFGFFHFLTPGTPSGGVHNLDTLLNNYDVAGIPTNGEFSSSLFSCFQNIIPSCVFSFFCPCIMFSQVLYSILKMSFIHDKIFINILIFLFWNCTVYLLHSLYFL